MKIYNYHSITGELLSESEADKSPLEKNVYLIPAYATKKKPPKVSDGEVCVFNLESNKWDKLPDLRGKKVYSKSTGAEDTVSSIGPLSDAFTTEQCPGEDYVFDIVTSKWLMSPSKRYCRLSSEIRFKRDQLLKESDWTQLPDIPISISTGYARYRHGLREITNQPGFPESVEWPTKPA